MLTEGECDVCNKHQKYTLEIEGRRMCFCCTCDAWEDDKLDYNPFYEYPEFVDDEIYWGDW